MRRMTKQRQAVAAALQKSPDFLSAKQLHAQMAAAGVAVGLATVYRNLQLLSEDGVVDSIRSEDGEVLYRSCDRPHHHHHLVCRSCQRSEEIEAGAVEEWVEQVAQKYGFVEVEHHADLFGLCQECARKKRS